MESSRKSFNKNSRADGVVRNADIRLRKQEEVVPETSFEIVFHFWKIEVGTGSTLGKLMCFVVKVQDKVEERA